MMKKFTLWLICIFLLFPVSVSAQQKCIISELRFVLDDSDNQNQKGLTVHFDMSVNGMKDKNGKVYVYICDKDGTFINSTVDNSYTGNNHIAKVKTYSPSYDSSRYNDFTVFVPYSAIGNSIADNIEHFEYKVNVVVVNENNVTLASQLSSSKFRLNSFTSTCLLCGGSGKEYCMPQTVVTAGDRFLYVTCRDCNGTGRRVCRSCNGRGIIGQTFFASYVNDSKSSQDGYVVVPIIQNVGTDNYVSSSTTTPNISRKTCPACGGTGKGMEEIIWAPQYTSSEEYCRICNSIRPIHTHHQPMCRACYGKGYIEF